MVADYEAASADLGILTRTASPNETARCGTADPGEYTTCRDWFSYVSAWRAGFSNRWRDCILTPLPSPARFAEYLVAGTSTGSLNYNHRALNQVRRVLSGGHQHGHGQLDLDAADLQPGARRPSDAVRAAFDLPGRVRP